MKSALPRSAFAVAALIALLVVLPFQPGTRRASYTFEFEAASSVAAMVQLFFDKGHDFTEADSVRLQLPATAESQSHRLPVASGTYRAFRLDPLDRPGRITLSQLVIRRSDGEVVHRFAPDGLRAQQHIASLRVDGTLLHVDTGPDGADPILVATVPSGFVLPDRVPWRWDIYLISAAGVLVLLGLIFWATTKTLPAAAGMAARLRGLGARHPRKCVLAVSAVAVVLSAYPVVFLGRSYVSPNYGSTLLYQDWPTLPGSSDDGVSNVAGSDVGAILWQHVPYSVVQHEALFRDFELPLWNRYSSTGIPLLGQGQSSFGDPLHWLPILFRGAAWAWDLKYLLAKTAFAFGLGLLVLETTRHRGVALVIAAVTPFIGFFLYRINHPAFFSLCYGPWIVYACWRISQASNGRQLCVAGIGLVVANAAELTSGTVKEAYSLLFGLNFAGAAIILLRAEPWRTTARKFALFLLSGVAFVGLTAPVWLTFLDTLRSAYTSYHEPTANQLPPGLLLGAIDEIFLRPFQQGNQVYNGSLNSFLALGLAWFALRARVLLRDRFVLALTLAAVPPAALAFGVIPPAWILQVPFLRNIAHVDNAFLCVLFVLAPVLAGHGLREGWERLGTPQARGDLACIAVGLSLLAALYLGTLQAVQRSHRVFRDWNESFPIDEFTLWYGLSLILGASLLLVAAFRWRQRRPTPALLMLAALGALLLVWRFAWHTGAGWSDFVVNARTRPDFFARSVAVEAARQDQPEPARAAGFSGNLFPGWTPFYGLETISGPDALMSPNHRAFVDAAGLARVWDWRVVVEGEHFDRLRAAYDFLGIRHYFDLRSDGIFLPQRLEPVRMADLDVFRSPTVWPRAFFTDRVVGYETAARFAKLVDDAQGRPLAAMAADELRPSAAGRLEQSLADRAVVAATGYQLTTNRTSFTLAAPTAGIAVLHETYWPRDFLATLNGDPVPVLRVNHLFKGVVIPAAGTYRVEFRYRPHRFSLALGLAGIGAAIVAVMAYGAWSRVASRGSAMPENVVAAANKRT